MSDSTRSRILEVMARASVDRQYLGKRRPAPHIVDIFLAEERANMEAALIAYESHLSAEGMAVVPGWQPIESAPKDGTHILLGSPDNEDDETTAVSTLGWWQDAEDDGPDYMGADGGFVDHAFSEFYPGRSFGNPSYQRVGTQPTHWRPLPAPPASPYGKASMQEESK